MDYANNAFLTTLRGRSVAITDYWIDSGDPSVGIFGDTLIIERMTYADGSEVDIESLTTGELSTLELDFADWSSEVIYGFQLRAGDVEDWYPDNDGQPDEAQEWHDFDPDC